MPNPVQTVGTFKSPVGTTRCPACNGWPAPTNGRMTVTTTDGTFCGFLCQRKYEDEHYEKCTSCSGHGKVKVTF